MPASPVSSANRQKRNHAKVRTGCQTCKLRRIKCSEERPICSRCERSDRECVYAVPKAWIFEAECAKPPINLTLLPAHNKLLSYDDRRAFEFFKQNTALEFSGHHDLAQKFWKFYIPRSATDDPIIYKLAAAIGARHEASLMGSSEADTVATKNHQVAISSLAHGLSQMRVDLSLLSCALLGAYANLCEEVPATAAIHYSLGLKIMREQQTSITPIAEELGAYIIPMFTELELTTALFIPSATAEMVAPQPITRPVLPKTFEDLYQAKRMLGDLLRWLIYMQTMHCDSNIELAAKVSEANELLSRWRQTLASYSVAIAASFPGLYIKARKMLFQYKLFDMCRGAARNRIFIEACRIRTISIDLSRPHITSVVCALIKDIHVDETWRPLKPQPSKLADVDDLDIWPCGEPVGHDGLNEITRVTLGG